MQQKSGYHQFFSQSFNEREYAVYHVQNSGYGSKLLSEFEQQGFLVKIGHESRADSKDSKKSGTSKSVRVAVNSKGITILEMLSSPEEFKQTGIISKKDLVNTFSEPVTVLSAKEAYEFDSLARAMGKLRL